MTDDIKALEELAQKFERPVQVFLDFRNVERAELIRRVIRQLSRPTLRERIRQIFTR